MHTSKSSEKTLLFLGKETVHQDPMGQQRDRPDEVGEGFLRWWDHGTQKTESGRGQPGGGRLTQGPSCLVQHASCENRFWPELRKHTSAVADTSALANVV